MTLYDKDAAAHLTPKEKTMLKDAVEMQLRFTSGEDAIGEEQNRTRK
jgi:hypothetical protein